MGKHRWFMSHIVVLVQIFIYSQIFKPHKAKEKKKLLENFSNQEKSCKERCFSSCPVRGTKKLIRTLHEESNLSLSLREQRKTFDHSTNMQF